MKPCSPRARGWTVSPGGRPVEFQAFPACAGMDREATPTPSRSIGVPRVRGDGPLCVLSLVNHFLTCSPRARGWTGAG